MREQLIRKAEIFPIEFIVRNIATGSLTKRLGIPEGTHLEKPLLEYCYKKDELNDPLISKDHIFSFGWATENEIKIIDQMTLRINDLVTGMFRAIGIKLVDFKLEYGKAWNKDTEKKEIVLADEISPDTCRLWDVKTEKKEIEKIDNQLNRINDFMVGMFRGIGIKLVDFKVEFGRYKNNDRKEIILADEISPDTCRLWDINTDKKLDKDRFRKDLGNLIGAYQDVARRLGILHEQSNIRPIKYSKPKAVKFKKNK